jgi:hypothetical protein
MPTASKAVGSTAHASGAPRNSGVPLVPLTLTEFVHCVLWCVQVGIIGPDKKFKILTSAEVQDYLQEVE